MGFLIEFRKAIATLVVMVLFLVAVTIYFKWGPLPIFFVIFLLKMARWRRNIRTTLGSARMANEKDLHAAGLTTEREGIIIGKTEKHFLRLPDAISPHMCFVAPTGAGKSTGFAISNLLIDDACSFVLDFKGELIRETAFARQQRFGHQIAIIAPFGLPQGINWPVCQFNPLWLIDPTSRTLLDEAGAIANALVVRRPNEHQPFFNDRSYGVIRNVLTGLLSEAPPELCTLSELRKTTARPDRYEQIIEIMCERAVKRPELLRTLGGELTSLRDRTEGDVLSTIANHLAFLDSPSVAQSLEAISGFQPERLLTPNKGLTIYFHVPLSHIKQYRGYVRVLVTSLVRYILSAGESRTRRIRFYLDESYALGRDLDALTTALVYGRSYGIRLLTYFQSVSQIEEVFEGNKAKTFQSNSVFAYTGIRDMDTAQAVSSWIGRQTIEVQTQQKGSNFGVSVSNSPTQGKTESHSLNFSRSKSLAEQAREVLQPEEIVQLPKSTTIITLPHVRPIICEPVFYFQNPALTKLANQSRQFARSTKTTILRRLGLLETPPESTECGLIEQKPTLEKQ